MNILVRVPKSEEEHFWEDTPGAIYEWWTLGKTPTKLKPGDYIYFQIKDKIEARAFIHSIQKGDQSCDATDRLWKGVHIIWPISAFEKLDAPLPGLPLTRGFCYVDF